ncbi:MAG TPA: lysylphosphatidylglycerol synthase domain-containing protein, partial [Gaiellales bacterium]|nr:lysylphosphatidylglycerol synthase domain-containing protein [Gaiellales bacterium]
VRQRRSVVTRWVMGRWVRVAIAVATLAILVWRVGTGPFIDGLKTVDGTALAAAAALAALTTVCSAWRWRVVARGLGVELPLGTAVAAYYRSLFLNVTLPGGVVGDVHRGVSHGRAVDDVGRGLRAVAWERAAGQVVQVVITVAVLLALLAMMAMVLPSLAGWGPREGATAWVFGAAGLGAGQGVATAVVYGVMVLVASLPGAVVLVAVWLRRARPPARREPLPARIRVVSRSEGAADA